MKRNKLRTRTFANARFPGVMSFHVMSSNATSDKQFSVYQSHAQQNEQSNAIDPYRDIIFHQVFEDRGVPGLILGLPNN